MVDIKKKYETLRKKYKLPEFKKIDSVFEISSIDDGKFLTRDIRRKIFDILETYSKSIEGILHPEATLNNLYESRFFSDKDKESIFKLYKELMVLQKRGLVVSTLENEKEDASFIIDVFNKWNLIKPELNEIFEKLKNAWEKDTDIKEDLSYFG